jgi:large subunit ribosomal protein L4
MSIKIKVYNQKCEPVSEMKLSDQVFGVKASEALVHQAVVTQMANERQVLAHTKERNEVRGGGKKPWRQKGTGRARAGSIRSPIWKGGGVTFGPRKDRNFKKKINKKMKQKAMMMVLSDRLSSGNLAVLDKLEMNKFKTKVFNEMLGGLEKKVLKVEKQENKKARKQESKDTKEQKNKKARKQENKEVKEQEGKNDKKIKRSILLVNDKTNEKVKYSGRNLAGVKIINLDNINILDLLQYRDLVVTMEAAKKLEEKYK